VLHYHLIQFGGFSWPIPANKEYVEAIWRSIDLATQKTITRYSICWINYLSASITGRGVPGKREGEEQK